MDSTPPSLFEQLRGPAPADAWARFVHLYTPLLLRWADRRGVPPADRADLAQDVFVAVYRALPKFEYNPDLGFRRWLYTVAANKWRDACRKKLPVPLADDDPRLDGVAGGDPAELVSETEYRAILAARAAQLIRTEFSPTAWSAFWNTAVEERGAAEVASELGMTANAVYLARARVLARLRVELAGLMD